MTNKKSEVISEKKRKILEEGREKYQDPEKVRAFLLAGGSVKTEHVIDSQQICREVRGKA